MSAHEFNNTPIYRSKDPLNHPAPEEINMDCFMYTSGEHPC